MIAFTRAEGGFREALGAKRVVRKLPLSVQLVDATQA
jgi:hypothetical protein